MLDPSVSLSAISKPELGCDCELSNPVDTWRIRHQYVKTFQPEHAEAD